MDWIKNNKFLFIIIIILIFSAIFIFLTFSASYEHSKRISKRDVISKSYAYGCQINFKKNRVEYFERKKIGNKEYKTLASFLSIFHNKDIPRIKDWVDRLKNDEVVADYLETEISLDGRSYQYCLLKFQKYEKEASILYIEFFTFLRMPSSQGRKKESNKSYSLVKRNQIESYYDSLRRKKGFVFTVNFFFRVQEIVSAEEIEKSVLTKFKNEVYAFSRSRHYYRFVLDEYKNSIHIFDFKMANKIQADTLMAQMYEAVQQFIAIKGYEDICGLTIGCAEISKNNNFNDLISMSIEAAESARSNSLAYAIFEDSNADSLMAYDKNIIEKIFAPGALRYYFRPILNTQNDKTVGYFGTVKCNDSHFESYFDISRYVNKVDRNKELLSTVLEYFVSKFYQERPTKECRIFLQISLVDLDHVCKVLNNIQHSEEVNLVLTFEETEVNANAFSLDLLRSQFNELKTLGYDIALLLKDENTLLESDFYENFDFFVIGSSMVSRVKESSRYRLSNKYLIESLLPYQRPIIINDLEGWSSIELFVKSGCTLLSSNELSPLSEMILPIEKSKIARVNKIK